MPPSNKNLHYIFRFFFFQLSVLYFGSRYPNEIVLSKHWPKSFTWKSLHVKIPFSSVTRERKPFFSCQPYNHLNRLVCPSHSSKKISLIRVVAILWLPRNTWKQNLLEGMLHTIENCLKNQTRLFKKGIDNIRFTTYDRTPIECMVRPEFDYT